MKLYFKCGCGDYNYNWNDWFCHFKFRGFKRGLKNLLLTKIQLRKEY